MDSRLPSPTTTLPSFQRNGGGRVHWANNHLLQDNKRSNHTQQAYWQQSFGILKLGTALGQNGRRAVAVEGTAYAVLGTSRRDESQATS